VSGLYHQHTASFTGVLPVELVAPFHLPLLAQQALVRSATFSVVVVLILVNIVALCMHPSVARIATNHGQVVIV
jgi:hypothetical protein